MKIGARLIRHARRLVLQMAEVAVTRDLLAQILARIRLLSPVPTWGAAGDLAMASEMMWMLPMRKRRDASCRACQREQGPRPLTTAGNPCRSRLSPPVVQVSGSQLTKYCSEWLTLQPTPRVPSLIWGIPAGSQSTDGEGHHGHPPH